MVTLKFSLKKFLKLVPYDSLGLTRLIEENGDIIPFTILKQRAFFIANPKAIKHIYTHSEKYKRTKKTMGNMHLVLGEYGLVTIQDQETWKKDRKILGMLFQPEIMQEYISIMIKTVDEQLQALEDIAKQNKPLDIDKYFTKVTLQNVVNTLFAGVSEVINDISPFSRKIFYLTLPDVYFLKVKVLGVFPSPLYFHYKKTKAKLGKIVNSFIKQSLSDNVPSTNLIKHLAKAYGFQYFDQLTDEMKEHLHSEATTFLLAGHETTSVLLGYVVTYLSLYPLIADKVREEVKSVLGSGNPTYQSLGHLPYTQAVIKETLRLHPPARMSIREALEDDTIEGYTIKKGDFVYIPVYATQRNSAYWRNPEAFNPERFLQPLTPEQQFLYMPFSLGERGCIGAQFAILQSTLIIAMLSQRFRLELTPGCTLEPDLGLVDGLNKNVTMKVTKND